jgi:cytochrome c-type biogenesis protein CcmH
MTVFVLVAALLCVAAVTLLTRPLWWRGKAAASASETAPAAASGGGSSSLVALIAVFVAVVATGGYAWLGAPDRLALGPASSNRGAPGSPATAGAANERAESPASAASRAEAMAKIESMVNRLIDHLKAQPDDADGWQMLARTYAALGKQQPAVDAFKQAEKLRPTDPTLLADYAVAVALNNNKDLEGEPRALIERALKANPKHPKALALAGTAAFGRKDYKLAVDYWEQLAKVEPPDSPMAEQIRESIAEARQMAGMPAAAPNSNAAAESSKAGPAAATAQVSGTVSLADKLKGRVSPDDTVFVFARAAEGSRMPLAIIRKQVKDLPFDFKLDDSLAMSPAARLSGAGKVIVGARVSKSGNAMPQSGDLQGLLQNVSVGQTDLNLKIDSEVGR